VGRVGQTRVGKSRDTVSAVSAGSVPQRAVCDVGVGGMNRQLKDAIHGMETEPGMRDKLSAHSDFLMVLMLFVSFRLLLLLLFTPASFFTSGFMSHAYYYEVAALSDQGHLPFIDFWFEYPPVFSYLVIGIYKLTRLVGEGFPYFSRLLSFVFLPMEMLTLINLYRIGMRLYGQTAAVRLAWIYSALLLPVYYWQHSFDTMVTALTLQSLYWLMVRRRDASAVTLGIAIATKFTPFILLAAAWRFAPHVRQAIIYTVIVGVVVAIIFMPFLLLSPSFTIASFQSLVAVSSWETIWALIDGNIVYGDVGTLQRHFDLTQAAIPVYNPPIVPWVITIPLFGLLFLFVYLRHVDRANLRQQIVFVGITMMLFLLWSKGWGPEWATWVIPFLLLLYPNWRGILCVLLLSFTSMLDWPISLAVRNQWLYVVGVLTRTALFAGIAIDLYLELTRSKPTAHYANEQSEDLSGNSLE
jgi:hypothetical protein